jgi:hypothetical protein
VVHRAVWRECAAPCASVPVPVPVPMPSRAAGRCVPVASGRSYLLVASARSWAALGSTAARRAATASYRAAKVPEARARRLSPRVRAATSTVRNRCATARTVSTGRGAIPTPCRSSLVVRLLRASGVPPATINRTWSQHDPRWWGPGARRTTGRPCPKSLGPFATNRRSIPPGVTAPSIANSERFSVSHGVRV